MKKYSTQFWVSFVIVSVISLTGWFIFWEVKNQGFGSLKRMLGLVPISQETRADLETVISLADAVLSTQGQEKVFLILFQNNLELRPGGGFIGSFGILKIKDGTVTDLAIHDTGNFDGRIPSTVLPPYPMKETLGINSWKFRDSNYSPDFPLNAKQAELFYQMGQGQEQFDGVVAITTNVLSSFLRVTGPVTLEGFPGTYGADNAVLDLEYQVEQGYLRQDIAFGDRKSVMSILGFEILKQVKELSFSKKYELFQVILDDLRSKDIQLAFKDELLQEEIAFSGWDGKVDEKWRNDYLLLVDANLNSFKSDYYMKRSYAYTIDLSSEIPQASLAVTYKNTAKIKDWFAKDYQTFLRVYIPQGSYIKTVQGASKAPVYGEDFNKKYVGVIVHIPILSEKTVTFEYTLPSDFNREWYDLKIQKQSGLSDVPISVTVIKKDGSKEEKNMILNQDQVLSESE
ncbi:MAG: DUF4012 domain-containing protein [Candidatus Moranbacteria bacterium]|nr:DUF4012 domain-containing protein [Candidatus Moranbacteria bacterium]MDD3964997.1 DUF4012 domain-containing protein [Candidatus Moranbacteria bacterium]